MESVVKVRECQWCHNPYYLSDGRYKYCSDECAEAAQIARCKKTCHRPEKIPQLSAWERYREKRWLELLTAGETQKNKNRIRRRTKKRRLVR